MVNRRGLTLTEILIASMVGGVVLFAGMRLLVNQSKMMKIAGDNVSLKTSLNAISGELQKTMASGDLRFLSFVGQGAADRTMARFLIPQVGKCIDLSTTGCEEDTAFLYVHYNKLTTPTLSAICNYSTTGPNYQWLVDIKNPTYGLATELPDGFNVEEVADAGFVAGKVTVKGNELIALMNPPYATLWVAQGVPTRLNITQDGAGVFSAPMPNECRDRLQVTSAGPPVLYDLSGLYLVTYRPLIMSQFTGGTVANVGPTVVTGNQGSYPLRIFSTQIRSMGASIPAAGKHDFSVRNCRIASGNVVCDGHNFATIPQVSRVRFEEIYSLRLNGSNAEIFQLIPDNGNLTPTCMSPQCTGLELLDNAAMKVLLTATESFDALDPTAFSLIKQEVLSRLRIRLTIGTKDEAFDVAFP